MPHKRSRVSARVVAADEAGAAAEDKAAARAVGDEAIAAAARAAREDGYGAREALATESVGVPPAHGLPSKLA